MTLSAMPSVTVILPTYNRAHLSRRSVGSVLAQTYENLELIVVDDASTDKTSEVVRAFRDSRLRYLRHENNKGAPAARNTGINAARGEFIAFQDSDDEWKPDKLAKQMARFATDPKLAVVYCGMLRHNEGCKTYIPDRRIKTRSGDISQALLRGNFVGTPAMVVRRTDLLKVGGFVEDLPRFQDWEFAIRLSRAYPFDLVDEALVEVYSTPGNITSDGPAGARACEMILERHYDAISKDREALARMYAHIGFYKSLYQQGDGARLCFLKALGAAPWSLPGWAGLLLSFLGPRALSLARQARRNLRHTGHALG